MEDTGAMLHPPFVYHASEVTAQLPYSCPHARERRGSHFIGRGAWQARAACWVGGADVLTPEWRGTLGVSCGTRFRVSVSEVKRIEGDDGHGSRSLRMPLGRVGGWGDLHAFGGNRETAMQGKCGSLNFGTA